MYFSSDEELTFLYRFTASMEAIMAKKTKKKSKKKS